MSGSTGFPSLAALVQSFESGGNYTATNPSSTASGAYGFLNSTWQQYAQQLGINTQAYPTAASAPPAVQDSVFAQAISQNGLADWTCPGCDPGLNSYLSSNPSAASLPVLGGSVAGSATSPQGSTASQPASWLQAIGGYVGGYASRLVLIVVGVVLVIGAVMMFGLRSQVVQEVKAAK